MFKTKMILGTLASLILFGLAAWNHYVPDADGLTFRLIMLFAILMGAAFVFLDIRDNIHRNYGE